MIRDPLEALLLAIEAHRRIIDLESDPQRRKEFRDELRKIEHEAIVLALTEDKQTIEQILTTRGVCQQEGAK